MSSQHTHTAMPISAMSFQQIALIAAPNAKPNRNGPPATTALSARPPNAGLIRDGKYGPADLRDAPQCFRAIQSGFVPDVAPHYWWMETKAVAKYCKQELIVKLNALLEEEHSRAGIRSRMIKHEPRGNSPHLDLIKWCSRGLRKDIKFQLNEHWVVRLRRFDLTADVELSIHNLVVLISETYHRLHGPPPCINATPTPPKTASIMRAQQGPQHSNMLAPMSGQIVTQEPSSYELTVQHPFQRAPGTSRAYQVDIKNTMLDGSRPSNTSGLQEKANPTTGHSFDPNPEFSGGVFGVLKFEVPNGRGENAKGPAAVAEEQSLSHPTAQSQPMGHPFRETGPASADLISQLQNEIWQEELFEPVDMVDEPLPPDPAMTFTNQGLYSVLKPFAELPPLFRHMMPPPAHDLSQLARCIRFAQTQSQFTTDWRACRPHLHELLGRCNRYGRELLRARTDIIFEWPGDAANEFWDVFAMRFAQTHPEEDYTAAHIGFLRDEVRRCNSTLMVMSYLTEQDKIRFEGRMPLAEMVCGTLEVAVKTRACIDWSRDEQDE